MLYGITDVGITNYAAIISTADLKAFLRVTHSDEDSLIEAMRTAAVLHVEGMTNTRLGDRNVVFDYSEFPKRIELPIGPLVSIGSIQLATSDSSTITIDSSEYFITRGRNPTVIEFTNVRSVFTDTFKALTINTVMGYTEASIPAPMIHAIKLLVAHMYELRQPEVTGTITNKLKMGLEALLNPYRIISFR